MSKINPPLDQDRDNEWDFYFGRGGGSNKKRQISKANRLVQSLALRYSNCRQTEKRLFARNEVYDTVVQNGGRFLLFVNKKYIDVTRDEDEAIKKIMQSFRDVNKVTQVGERFVDPTIQPKFKQQQRVAKAETIEIITGRPKRRCIRPSAIEQPIVNSVVDALQVIMNDTTSNLPIDSQHSINRNLCLRAQRLEKIIESVRREHPLFCRKAMADETKLSLSEDSQQSINQNLHSRLQRLESLVTSLLGGQNGDINSGDKVADLNEYKEESDDEVTDEVVSGPSITGNACDHDEGTVEESFDAASGISDTKLGRK